MNQDDVFQSYRSLLFSIAYRMLGSVRDAEDGVQDEQVRVHQLRIDQQRLAYLEAVVSATRANRLYAQQLARVLYSIYVGSQHMIPPIQGEDLSALYQFVQQCFAKESQ